MRPISSAELQRRFGAIRQAALREPVAITNRGRESLVLLSAAEYRRLKALDDRRSVYAHELPDDLKRAIDEVEPPDWTARFDHELE